MLMHGTDNEGEKKKEEERSRDRVFYHLDLN